MYYSRYSYVIQHYSSRHDVVHVLCADLCAARQPKSGCSSARSVLRVPSLLTWAAGGPLHDAYTRWPHPAFLELMYAVAGL
jgi:hypothetical protein